MNTFTSYPGEAGKTPATPTPSSNASSAPKNIDINTVYMFLEELKVSFEKGQAKQSDGSQVQTEVVNPKAFQKILAEELPKFTIQVEGPELDYSKIPKPKEYTQSFADLGKKIEDKDSDSAKALNKPNTSIGTCRARSIQPMRPRMFRELRKQSSLTPTLGSVSAASSSASSSASFSACGFSSSMTRSTIIRIPT